MPHRKARESKEPSRCSRHAHTIVRARASECTDAHARAQCEVDVHEDEKETKRESIGRKREKPANVRKVAM